jgi:LysR family cys regulon transcriptional activator
MVLFHRYYILEVIMTLQQLRCLCKVVDQGLNLSRAARALNTSQPAVTKMIRAMEQEFGAEILMRAGPRIVNVTQSGQEVLTRARQILRDIDNLKLAVSDSGTQATGTLRIAATHLHARHVLCEKIRRFTRKFPAVDISLTVGTQAEIMRWTSSGEVDIGIGALPDNMPANLLRLDAHPISRCVVAPIGHPILRKRKPTLEDIGRYPLITYDRRSRTGELVEHAFAAANITPKVTLKANSADIIKTYVAAGMGIAIMQVIAVTKQDRSIRAVNVDHLFSPSKCWIVLRRDQYIRRFLHEFIAMIAPKWTPEAVERQRGR